MGWLLDFWGTFYNYLKPFIMYSEKVYNEYYPDHHLSVDEYFETFWEDINAQLGKMFDQPFEGLSKAIENSKTLLSRRDCQVLDDRLFNILDKNLGRTRHKALGKRPTRPSA
jgi:hypothetical protein